MSMQINTNANYTSITRPPVIDVMEKRRLEAQNTNPPTTNIDGPAVVYESSGLLGKDAERLSGSNLKFGADAQPLGLLADRLSATNNNVKTFAEAFTSVPVANTNAKPLEESFTVEIPAHLKQLLSDRNEMEKNKMELMTETAKTRVKDTLSDVPYKDIGDLMTNAIQDAFNDVQKFWDEKFTDNYSQVMSLDDIRKEFADWKALQ